MTCTKCKTELPVERANLEEAFECPGCQSELRVDLFPAFFLPPPAVKRAEAIVVDGESSCFYHPRKKADIVCDGCGRFLCVLCDLEVDGRHLCGNCLGSEKEKGKLSKLENQRTNYDSIALSLAILPLLFFLVTIVTAPIALFYVIRYWNHSGSLVRRGKWRFVLAGIFAVLEILGWVLFFAS